MNKKAAKASTKKTATQNSETHYTLSDIVALHGIDMHGATTIDTSIYEKVSCKSTASKLYYILAIIAGDNSNQARINLSELAVLLNRTQRTTKRWLNFLEQKGIIEQKASDFFVIHDGYRDNLEA